MVWMTFSQWSVYHDHDERYYTQAQVNALQAAQDAIIALNTDHRNNFQNPHQVGWDQLTNKPPVVGLYELRVFTGEINLDSPAVYYGFTQSGPLTITGVLGLEATTQFLQIRCTDELAWEPNIFIAPPILNIGGTYNLRFTQYRKGILVEIVSSYTAEAITTNPVPTLFFTEDIVMSHDFSQYFDFQSHYADPVYSWTGNIPNLTFSTASGELTGTPLDVGQHTGIIVTCEGVATSAFTIEVVPAELPEVVAASVEDSQPDAIVITFSEDMACTLAGWSVVIDEAPANLVQIISGANASEWILSFSGVAQPTSTITLSYDEQLGATRTADAVKPLRSLTFSVVNNTLNPVVASAIVKDATPNQIDLLFSEHVSGTKGFSISVNDIPWFADGPLAGSEAEHVLPITDVETLLDAQFDLNPDPTDLTDAQELHDDYPTNGVGIIRKGSLVYRDGATLNALTLTGGKAVLAGASNTQSLNEINAHTPVAGLTAVAKSTSTASSGTLYTLSWLNSNAPNHNVGLIYQFQHNTGGSDLLVRSRNAAGPQESIKVVAGAHLSNTLYEYALILGGYTGGVPDPAGAEGCLYRLDGKLIYSSAMVNDRGDPYAGLSGSAAGHDLDSLHTYIDPAPLATPARSLFATDHADIADYVPEDGNPMVAVLSNGVKSVSTSGGSIVLDSTGGSWTAAVTELAAPMAYAEASLVTDYHGWIQFRTTTEENWPRVYNGFSAIKTLNGTLDIAEHVNGSETNRGSSPVATPRADPWRVMVSDDGENINAVGEGVIVSYVSTVGAGRVYAGVGVYNRNHAVADWFCVRATR